MHLKNISNYNMFSQKSFTIQIFLPVMLITKEFQIDSTGSNVDSRDILGTDPTRSLQSNGFVVSHMILGDVFVNLMTSNLRIVIQT